MKKPNVFSISVLVVMLVGLYLAQVLLDQRDRDRLLPAGDLPNRDIVFLRGEDTEYGDHTLGFINADGSGLVTRTLELNREIFNSPFSATCTPEIVPNLTWSGDGHLAGHYAMKCSAEGMPFVISSAGAMTYCSSQMLYGTGRAWFEQDTLVTIQDSPEGQTIVRLDANECQTLAAFPWSHEERRAGDELKDVSISRHGWLAVERWVGGYTVRETVVIDAAGTQQFVLPNASWAAWSPDGESLAYVSISEGLYMVDKANSQSRKLASGAHISSPSWSPDGQWLVYARPDSLDEEKSTIFKLQLETGAETTLFVGGTSPAWRMTQDSTK